MALAAVTLGCLTYQCAYPALPTGICIDRDDTRYLLYPCPAELPYCPLQFYGARSACTAQPSAAVLPAFIGNACSPETPCVYGKCEAGVCAGRIQMQTCSSHLECDLGLRCEYSHCVPVIPVHGWGCRVDTDCDVTSGCNGLQGAWNGTCVPYYSIGDGGVVTSCVNGHSQLCTSGFCLASTDKYPIYHCIAAPASLKPLPVACSSDADCQGRSYPWSFQSTCECGYTPTGSAYCAPLLGDSPGLALTQTLRAFARKLESSSCNTARRWQDDCLRKVDSGLFEQYQRHRLYFYLYPKLQENDACVRRILTREYWDLGLTVGLGSLIVSILA